MKRFIIIYIDGGLKKNKSVWAKTPDLAKKAFRVLYPNAGILGMVED